MDNDNAPQSVDLRPVTKIIASYVGNHTLAPDQLSALIISVQQAIRQLGKPVEPEAVRTPAVPVRRSVQRNYVVCLECGFKGKTYADISGCGTGCRSASICGAGICRATIRLLHPPIPNSARRWPK